MDAAVQALSKLGQFEEAVEILSEILSVQVASEEAGLLASNYKRLALQCQEKGDTAGEKAKLDEARLWYRRGASPTKWPSRVVVASHYRML